MNSDDERGGPGPDTGVGGYVLREVLGCGATGTVWRADGPDGPVAVKCLHPELAGDVGVVDRFLAEHSMLTGVVHPNLVQILDLVTEPGVLALILELVDGVNLRERIEGGPVPAAEAASIGAGICRALVAVHAAGIVHRDVKPENVLLEHGGVARLTDFGVAFAVGQPRSTTLGRPVGTAEYVAPELVGGATPSAAADVYAVGVLLYELLTGQPPFKAADPLAVLYRHVHVPPAYPMVAPAELAALVLRCLAKDPADRPGAAEPGRPARRWQNGRTSAARSTSGRVRARGSRHRRSPPVVRPRRSGGARRHLDDRGGRGGRRTASVVRHVDPGAAGPPSQVYAAPTGWICTDVAIPARWARSRVPSVCPRCRGGGRRKGADASGKRSRRGRRRLGGPGAALAPVVRVRLADGRRRRLPRRGLRRGRPDMRRPMRVRTAGRRWR